MNSLEERIEEYLLYREKRGFSREPHDSYLQNFYHYLSDNFKKPYTLSEESVRGWLAEEQALGKRGLSLKANSARLLGEYMKAMGDAAYILPNSYTPYKKTFAPYIMNDEELAKMMGAADALIHAKHSTNKFDPRSAKVVPILFRLWECRSSNLCRCPCQRSSSFVQTLKGDAPLPKRGGFDAGVTVAWSRRPGNHFDLCAGRHRNEAPGH